MFATFEKKIFDFIIPGGTSRGVLTQKTSWFIYLKENEGDQQVGIGECSIIPGLSPDFQDIQQYESKIRQICMNIDYYLNNMNQLQDFPSILFGIETAQRDLRNGGKRIIFNNTFSEGKRKIPINGLIWMGDADSMNRQIEEKLSNGFTCLKMKIGAIDFEEEYKILKGLREQYSVNELTIRLDANGAFHPKICIEILKRLSDLQIHSIEQPIAPRQEEWMKLIIERSPIPIALDEELIGVNDRFNKEELLDFLQPHFIILKPSLHGGIKGSQEWIKYASVRKINWWLTSALVILAGG